MFFDDALKRARELDQFFKDHGRVVGPLHGVPMTLKDQFNVRGYDTTLGYVGRAFKPATEDSVLVSMLKLLGAVIIAKSNLPQSIMVRHAFSIPHLHSQHYAVLTMLGSGAKLKILYGG